MTNFESKNDEAGRETAQNDEINPEKIQRLFQELPSEEIELLANNLARPDGFTKTLILGQIMTSTELRKRIDPEFVKTHRGYYNSLPPSHHHKWGENDYISFNVGKAQRRYQENSGKKFMIDWTGGLGFAIPAEAILAQNNVTPNWGGFQTKKAIKTLKGSPLSEKQFEKFYDLTGEQCWDTDRMPPKKDFLALVHMARKAGTLDSDDQGEINMHPDREVLPHISLDSIIILIPASSKEAFKRYLSKKLKEIAPFAEKIKNLSGVDITLLNADKVLERYPNIYWYQQENIGLAIEYLSAHKEKVGELISSIGLTKFPR